MAELDALHERQLAALLAFDAVCRKLDVEYFVMAGTLLGAVRHAGFIPWDDDVDLGMLRKDYERFAEQAPALLGEEYFLQSFDTEPNFALCYAKLRMAGTTFAEVGTTGADIHHGVFLDLFIFDNAPDSRIARAFHLIAARVLIMAVQAKSGFDPQLTGMHRVLFDVVRVASWPWRRRALIRALQRVMVMFDDQVTGNVVNIGGAYGYARETSPRASLLPTSSLTFEGHDVRVPRDYDGYLTRLYGDYMTPPKEADRVPKHASHWTLDSESGSAAAG